MTADPSMIFTAPIVRGSGAAAKQNCSVELLGLAIYGDYRHGFALPCIDGGAQALVVSVQDRLSDESRQSRRWRLLIARLSTCHATGNDRVRQRMALWAARRVEHLSDDARVTACNDTVERWLAGDATDEDVAAWATSASWAATWAATWAPAGPVRAAAGAARAAWAAWAAAAATTAWAEERAAARAAGAAAAASALAGDGALMELVDDYLSAWHKVAVDEGCLLPDEADEDYQAFLAALDFHEAGQVGGS